MAKLQRWGLWFLCPACVFVLICSAQRMLSPHTLQMGTAASIMLTHSDTVQQDDDMVVIPYELSVKSLLSMPPMLFDTALLVFGLLKLLLVSQLTRKRRFFPPRVISLLSLRIHPRFCVFRE